MSSHIGSSAATTRATRRAETPNASADLGRKPASSVVGTVRGSVPYVGYGLYLLQQPLVFLGLLILTGGTLVLHELGAILAELRRIRDRRRGVEHAG